jgi:protein O-mannosyl-transferase
MFENREILSTLFWLLTMWAYVSYVRRPSASRYLLIVGFFGLGLMAKPMLVTLPLALLLMDIWPLKRLTLAWPLTASQRSVAL